jgi:hypothetical protein
MSVSVHRAHYELIQYDLAHLCKAPDLIECDIYLAVRNCKWR